MGNPNFWLDLFTGVTWDEFRAAGSNVSGFRKSRWKGVQRIKQGDYFICHLTEISRFIGTLEILSRPYEDTSKIWKDEEFPIRFKVKPIIELTPETAIPVHELKGKLSFFQNLKNPLAWTGRFRGSPSLWKQSDGRAFLDALLEAERNPAVKPFDLRKLLYPPRILRAKIYR